MTDPAAPAVVAPTPHARAGVGPVRHLVSFVVAMVATPIGMVLVDAADNRATTRLQTLNEHPLDTRAAATLIAGGVLLLVVAVCGRISGLGPLVAGLVWGGGPLAWVVLDPRGFSRFVYKAPRLPGFDATSFADAYALLAAVLVLLVGCGISGRWR